MQMINHTDPPPGLKTNSAISVNESFLWHCASGIQVETEESYFDQIRIDETSYVSRLHLHNVTLNTPYTTFQCAAVHKNVNSERKRLSFTIKGLTTTGIRSMRTHSLATFILQK